MGNLMSAEATPSDVKKYGVSNETIIEDKILIDKILRKSKEMYDQNYKSFLNEEFCNNVFVAYSKKLYELPIKKSVIEGAYKQLNSDTGDDFKLVIKSRSLDDEKYLINELTGRIIEHFKGKDYVKSTMHEGVNLTFPDIAYIQQRALMLLDRVDKIEKQKQEGGKSKRKHPLFLDTEGGANGYNNEENNNENNENNEENNNSNNTNNRARNRNLNTRPTNENISNNRNIRTNNRPNQISIPEKTSQDYPPPGLSKKQKKQWWREQKGQQIDREPQNSREEELNNFNALIEQAKKENNTVHLGPRVKNNKNNGKQNNANTANNANNANNIFKSTNLGFAPIEPPSPAPVNTKVKFSNNRIGMSEFGKLLNSNKTQQPQQPQQPQQQRPQFQKPPQKPRPQFQSQPFPKKESFYTGKMSNEELRRRKDIESSGDRHCTDEALECKLTKKQMCEKITYHFIVVNNLIATIVSVVPFPNQSGDKYAGGFMFDRMESLRTGNFCLPPHHSEISAISQDERLHKIFKYINILPKDNLSFEETCKKSGGFILKLSKERMEELGRDEKFGRGYYDFFKKINLFYQEALLNLYNILESLQNNTSISTRRLNELSARTKQIIDELYLKTQFNYLMAVLVILDFNFAKNTKETKEKDDRIKFIKSKLVT